MQVIDEDYIAGIAALPDGNRRLLDLFTGALERADTAEAIAKCTVAQIQPLKKRVDQLLDANNRLVFEKRDLRTELQAQIDAAHAELDQHRGMADFLEVQDSPEEAAQLLAWFGKRTELDLVYEHEIEPSSIPPMLREALIPESGWLVHKRHGGRNDQEWTLVAIGQAPIEALRRAHKAFCDGR